MQRRKAKNRLELPPMCLETERSEWTGENPCRNGPFADDDGFYGSGRLDGGRDRDRTCDPLDVNEVLSR